ncbi:Evolutionarily conserved signaling intermediate in Toll pathway, mitochondrial [Clarias magur]|uniref:Evolutionarily conserved signaling intermediate in Toll pathway, mitochondrial n=1 Tax=Clarias magur TaxID=1594786 RepID=A0A8J4WSA5_CLAMG|nr:Evolutionarily conserved signaling intermediate in Toll pathway, mitochondrial [Clarias magur]
MQYAHPQGGYLPPTECTLHTHPVLAPPRGTTAGGSFRGPQIPQPDSEREEEDGRKNVYSRLNYTCISIMSVRPQRYHKARGVRQSSERKQHICLNYRAASISLCFSSVSRFKPERYIDLALLVAYKKITKWKK